MATCFCMGPQNGEPLCPCQMRALGVFKRDGEWILPAKEEQVLSKVDKLNVLKEQVLESLNSDTEEAFTAESNYEVIKEIYRKKQCLKDC